MNRRIGVVLLALVLVGGALFLWQSQGTQVTPSQKPGAIAAPVASDRSAPDSAPTQSGKPQTDVLEQGHQGSDGVREALDAEGVGNALRGTVRDELGQPIANFTLAARFKPKVKGARWEDHDLGDFAAGKFALNILQEGRWRFLPACEGYSAGKSKVIKVPYDGDPIAIVLVRQAVLTGQVLDPNGEGVSNASIHLRDHSMGDGVITQGDGTFRMTLKPGPYACLAKSEVYSASEEVEGTIGLGEVQKVTLQLGLGARLEGRVKDFEGNVGVDWVVDLRNSQFHLDRRTVRTNDQGEFVIEHAAPGTYWVTAQGTSSTVSGSRPLRETVELIEGQTTRLELGGINETSIRVTGTVYKDGAPEPKARVWANMEGAKAFSSSMTTQADESGRFEVHFPEAGPANFLVAAEANQLVPIPFLLKEVREQEIDIHVPCGQISGRVTQPGGGKFKRRMVKCSPEGRNPIHSLYLTRTTRCESDGSFSFGYLPEGTYRVQVASVIDPKSVAEDVVLIEDGHVKGLELQIRGTGRATVKVLDPEGKPVDGAFVFIQDAQGNAHAAGSTRTTNGAGELKLSKLGVGEYRFFASHGDFASTLSGVTHVSTDTPVTQTVELVPGATATIQVLDGTMPIPARLWILNDAGHEFTRTMDRIDHPKYLREGHSSQKYDLGPLPPGKYLVRARVLDGREAQGELQLKVGSPASLELQMDS